MRNDSPNSGNAFNDEEFLIRMAQYHQNQDRIIRPCARNDTIRPELREWCAQSDQQHAERVERMREWLKKWYNKDLPKPDPYPLWLSSLKG